MENLDRLFPYIAPFTKEVFPPLAPLAPPADPAKVPVPSLK